MIVLKHMALIGWKQRRGDARVERHWQTIAAERQLTKYEAYQAKWNFIEREYNARPSNNGLDSANPGFAYETKLARYLKPVEVGIT